MWTILIQKIIEYSDKIFHRKEPGFHKIEDKNAGRDDAEIQFKPARVILQDFTGVAALVDLAAMRNATKRLGGDPKLINPIVPVDLVIDHSIQVDKFGNPEALEENEALEIHRNRERFSFLKWGANAFKGLTIIPPGVGIVHQVNLEYLARVVFKKDGLLYPDSVVGTDSHTPMVNGIGVVGWGVGGIEAEAVMLDQPISMALPPVIGIRLSGKLDPNVTSTDLVLAITNILRKRGVVNKFVEFYGPGVAELAVSDRATISNMSPETGATVLYFPLDKKSIEYMKLTNRDPHHISCVEGYSKANMLFCDYNTLEEPVFTEKFELDLNSIIPAISGPKRPHDYIPLSSAKSDFDKCLKNEKNDFKGFGIPSDQIKKRVRFEYQGKEYELSHGSVVIAAITSCTNTSNPLVMLGAGLLAKKAYEAGLEVKPYIKTSLAPGSGVVFHYLNKSGTMDYLEKLGFYIVGYGCTTCIGNSGPLPDIVSEAIEKNDLVTAGVLSGNRNFEGRIHPNSRANYLASPPLVVAYAIAGTVDIDLTSEPLGISKITNKPVYLKDIWPSRDEIEKVVAESVVSAQFNDVYSKASVGSSAWTSLNASDSLLYNWDDKSTYIHQPPYFIDMKIEPNPQAQVKNARVLLLFGDSITTDHISPAGNISKNSPAAKYLMERSVSPVDFNSYGSRRGNDEVMARGTFANIRLINKMVDKTGPFAIHLPTKTISSVYEIAQKYIKEKTPLVIIAGHQYGSGSSRDWAAKGTSLLGVKAVIAQSYERIHRSNLVQFGVIPFQFKEGENSEKLGLTGEEVISFDLGDLSKMKIKPIVKFTAISASGAKTFEAIALFDTLSEITYFQHGGVLPYVIRESIQKS